MNKLFYIVLATILATGCGGGAASRIARKGCSATGKISRGKQRRSTCLMVPLVGIETLASFTQMARNVIVTLGCLDLKTGGITL